jgi:hypothetical protein
MILAVDVERQRVALGIKQLSGDDLDPGPGGAPSPVEPNPRKPTSPCRAVEKK